MSGFETTILILTPIGLLAKAITMAFANMTQVKLSHVYIYRFPFCCIGKRLKTDSAEVQIIIQGRVSITKDMIEVEGHLQIRDAILLEYAFALVTYIFAATVSAFLVYTDSEVNALPIFLGCADDNETVASSRARRCSHHLPIDSIVMANLSIRYFAHKDGRSVLAAFSQVHGVYAVKANLHFRLYEATRVGIIGRLCLIGSHVCQGNVHMIEADAPSVFGDKALPDKVLSIGVELKCPRLRTTPTATDEHSTDYNQDSNA
jgi:hypothetical protein